MNIDLQMPLEGADMCIEQSQIGKKNDEEPKIKK